MNVVTLLQVVPWVDLITNAPKIALKAKEFWNTVQNKPTITPEGVIENKSRFNLEAQKTFAFEARIDALETQLAEQHKDILTSAALLNELATQNAAQVQRINLYQTKLKHLGILTIVMSILAVTSFIIAIASHL
ncbi:hypothetical protein A7981_08240 [Methylovorus sp. MM2]|uniref:hypothetical protein n=1 Tax=Methylovorus sp. MM2 TaxID=1848038 RepID=UPI0007E1D532|nr:hypothetical protein [Methylovorus sp. MM2]OAM51478.1 hypothetical protein A7981_08240 [Methylovorus sp. MM2]